MLPTQLLVFDLDGTLLDLEHRIPADIRDRLFALRKMGIETTLATGRPFASVKQFIRELELRLPVIVFNGAVVITPEGRSLSSRHLPLAAAKTIVRLLEETSAANHVYVDASDDSFYTDRQGVEAELIRTRDGVGCRYVPSLLDVLGDATCDPVKIFSIGDRTELEALQALLRDIAPTISSVFSEHDMLEFLGPNVNKGTALPVLCDESGIPCESVIAFGDNMNDFEMLQTAGTGVAMAEAPEKLQQAADYVTSDIEAFLANRFKGL